MLCLKISLFKIACIVIAFDHIQHFKSVYWRENIFFCYVRLKKLCIIKSSLFSVLFFLSGAEIRSVCTEAGMFAIRARRKMATEKDFLDAVNKVIKAYAKFSATPRYMTYN